MTTRLLQLLPFFLIGSRGKLDALAGKVLARAASRCHLKIEELSLFYLMDGCSGSSQEMRVEGDDLNLV